MGKKYNNQIKAGSGFTISGGYPIDDRAVVVSYSDLATLVTNKVSYEGMEVYVEADKKAYRLIDGAWVTGEHSHSEYINQNAFSNIVVSGQTTVGADSITDTVTFEGSNLTITTDATNDKVTFGLTAENLKAAAATDSSIKLTDETTSYSGHYTPESDEAAKISVSASSSTTATWAGTSLVTGINLQRDAKGHVTDITVDSVKMPANPDTDTHYSSKNIVGSSSSSKANANTSTSSNTVYLNHIENNNTITSSHKISGSGITTVTSDASGNITITSTESPLTITSKTAADDENLVYVVNNVTNNGHAITPAYTPVPTKKYIDDLLLNGVNYLGTIDGKDGFSGLSTEAGIGDFYRIATEFTYDTDTGEKAHVGDILLANKANPSQTKDDWDIIHTEIDTNTWNANTKNASGYVDAGASHNNQVWMTDNEGNPAWRTPTAVQIITWGEDD